MPRNLAFFPSLPILRYSLRDSLDRLRQPLALRGTLPERLRQPGAATTGFFNPVHPHTIEVLGDAGAAYVAALTSQRRAVLTRKLKSQGLAVLIAAEGAAAGDRAWRAGGITVLRTLRPAHEVVHEIRRELAQANATHTTLHSVFLDVYGLGLLIEGAAGSGKSTLALDLVARGHALVADDAVEIRRPARGILLGQCPPLLKGYLEARGLGVLDLRRLHGARAVRAQRRLDLIVRLVPGRPRALSPRQRLGGRRTTRRVLGESVPVLSLPAQSGHNLAPLVEAACLDQRLRQDGGDAAAALSRRQARAIKRGK